MDENNDNNNPPVKPSSGSKIKVSGKNAARIGGAVLGGPLGLATTEGVIRAKARNDVKRKSEDISRVNKNAEEQVQEIKNPTESNKQVLGYTSKGFLMGSLGSRIKERFFAKNATKNLDQPLPNKGEGKKDTLQKEEKPKRQKRVNNLIKRGLLFSVSPSLFLFGSLLPKTIKDRVKSKYKGTATKVNTHKNTVKNKIRKNAIQLQSEWIETTIQKATLKGYDKFALLKKVKDWKVWKSVAWKTGKYAAGGASFIGIDAYKRLKNQGNAKPAEQTTEHQQYTYSPKETSEPSSSKYYGSHSSFPRPLSPNAWGRITNQRIPNLNSTIGKKFRQQASKKIASNATNKIGEKISQQLVSSGARAILFNPAVLTGVAVILFFVLVVIIVIMIASGGGGNYNIGGGTGGGGGVGQPPTQNPIPSFTLQKTVSQTELAEIGEITYTIFYTLTSDSTVRKEDIIIFDQIPENTILVDNKTSGNYTLDTTDRMLSWNLSDSGNAAASSFTFTVLPVKTDINVTNSAWAQASASTGGPGGSQSPNACTRPKEGTGYCSYEHLLPYFNNQPDLALTASLICNLESGSDPFATNKLCPDYSIGLFQINLIAHCGGAFSPPPACTVLNSSLRNACEERFLNPIENIQYAYQLYLSGGTGWTANKWSTYPAAQSILASCGNI